ncbi:MAG: ABC transporter permease subunit [Bacteroidales bacterium]|nr:ABC transporter permease subunit [Bacteroidales bacterium]
MKKIIANTITGAVVFLIWEFSSRLELVDPTLLPPASNVFINLGHELVTPDFLLHIGATLRLMLGGFLLAIIIGVPLGMFMGLNRKVDSLLLFYVDFIRSLPAAALIPMYLVLFQGQIARILVIGTACGVIMAIGSRSGVLNMNPTRKEVATLLGWKPYELFKKLLLWETISEVLLSARIALSTSLILATVIEMLLGARYGLGDVLINSMPTDKPRMYAVIIILGILGYLLNMLFKIIELWLKRIGLYK